MEDAMREDPTLLIHQALAGDGEAFDAVFATLREEMEAIAASLMRQESREVTLQAGVLLSECYLKLRSALEGRAEDGLEGAPPEWSNREEFLRYAARAMRSILLDAARRRQTQKRGSGAIQSVLAASALGVDTPPEDLLFFDEAVEKLRSIHPDHGAMLELVFFGGVSYRAAGCALGLSRRSTERIWAHVQPWLLRELGKPPLPDAT